MLAARHSYGVGIFSTKVGQSSQTARNVSSSWYQFSKFVPLFLKEIIRYVNEDQAISRIKSIIEEELGCEKDGYKNHAELYRLALLEVGIVIEEERVSSIPKFWDDFQTAISLVDDKEAFSIGVSFGLEIIAEENIIQLLKYSSPTINCYEKLKESSFFVIHLKNEKEHIEKSIKNARLIIADSERSKAFQIGMNLSLCFWKEFWKEAIK
jgi:hypothetical protein